MKKNAHRQGRAELNRNIDVSQCDNCVHFITRGIGYVICGYWKYHAQMATYVDEQDKKECIVDCPGRYESMILHGDRHGRNGKSNQKGT